MKCRRCKGRAVIDLPRHNAAFCGDCLIHMVHGQVEKAIRHFKMIESGDKVLVAVSGGKDSLALWQILAALGYETEGVFLGLGIADYSSEAEQVVQRFASDRNLTLHVTSLTDSFGFDIPTAAAKTRRSPCGSCGLSKRHILNSEALRLDADLIATGHNLDDEAAVLFGNVLRWESGYLARQYPVLPASPGFARKVKPLVRLTERETAAYCIVSGIDYQETECPMSAGNRHLRFKTLLNEVERDAPGSKSVFLHQYFDHIHERFAGDASKDELMDCHRCGTPTTSELCAFCRLADRVSDPVRLVAPTVDAGVGHV
ncbi:MAG: adenine nucleotide alpha hydrolase family protein [Actinobacteria bacterium]|nr:adenine nucleotide alpha hydrolase family protein [Actinomycetota bacterium]MCB9388757.1 adenine nucleotide alpha hydrolase family protein [Acidimicrobiia bacterium]